MKKALLILGTVFAVIGILLCLVFGGLEGFWGMFTEFDNFALDDAKVFYEISDEELATMAQVSVKCDIYTVFVNTADVEKLTVKYIEDKNVTVECKAEGGVVTVTEKCKNTWFFGMIIPRQNRFLQVLVPKDADVSGLSVKVVCNTGGAILSDLAVGDVELDLDTGKISVEKTTAAAIKLKTDTGAIHLADCEAATLNAKSSTGLISVKAVAEQVELKTNTGAVTAELTAQTFVADANTGSVKFTVTSDHITVTNNTGSVSGVVLGNETEYTVKARSDVGSCNLVDRTGTTDKTLDVKVDVGSIDVKFQAEQQ